MCASWKLVGHHGGVAKFGYSAVSVEQPVSSCCDYVAGCSSLRVDRVDLHWRQRETAKSEGVKLELPYRRSKL